MPVPVVSLRVAWTQAPLIDRHVAGGILLVVGPGTSRVGKSGDGVRVCPLQATLNVGLVEDRFTLGSLGTVRLML